MEYFPRNADSDVLDRMRTYEAPATDFDPFTAEHASLVAHGFPRRPDPQTEPVLYRLWSRALTRTPRMMRAELAIDPVMSRRDPLAHQDPTFGPSGWGGTVVRPSGLSFNPPEPAKTVFGRWTVPGTWAASGQAGDDTTGFWVGLDGFTNGQVLQAGIAATVSKESHVSWWAWTEWYTTKFRDPAVAVTNFLVEPGDVVSILVCAPRPDHGFVSMSNETTGQATSVGIDARPGITSAGDSAEWIIEGVSADLPPFCPVTFGSCSAGTQHHSFNLKPAGVTTEIAGTSANLTSSSITSTTTSVISWQGAD
jgi:hypothetical protein